MTTATVAEKLNVSTRRVQAMIKSGRIKATREGHEWVISPLALVTITLRKAGRPSKKSMAAWMKGV